MRQIRIIFEHGENKMGYIIDPTSRRVKSGSFDKEGKDIIESSQDGIIKNSDELCKQIYYVLQAAINDAG